MNLTAKKALAIARANSKSSEVDVFDKAVADGLVVIENVIIDSAKKGCPYVRLSKLINRALWDNIGLGLAETKVRVLRRLTQLGYKVEEFGDDYDHMGRFLKISWL